VQRLTVMRTAIDVTLAKPGRTAGRLEAPARAGSVSVSRKRQREPEASA
jgi:hypothetical protein